MTVRFEVIDLNADFMTASIPPHHVESIASNVETKAIEVILKQGKNLTAHYNYFDVETAEHGTIAVRGTAEEVRAKLGF